MSKSVIELCAESICEAAPEASGYCYVKYGKTHYIPMAKAALTTLAANLDIDGLEAAYDTCGVDAGKQNSGAREYVKDAIQSYLNAIKEGE